jgi:hypothetical protein
VPGLRTRKAAGRSRQELNKDVTGHDLPFRAGKYAGPFNHVAQFANVSRPFVPHESRDRRLAKRYAWTESRHKRLGELLDVPKALSQGRQLDGKNGESVK